MKREAKKEERVEAKRTPALDDEQGLEDIEDIEDVEDVKDVEDVEDLEDVEEANVDEKEE